VARAKRDRIREARFAPILRCVLRPCRYEIIRIRIVAKVSGIAAEAIFSPD
jgi:hypothetical protein